MVIFFIDLLTSILGHPFDFHYHASYKTVPTVRTEDFSSSIIYGKKTLTAVPSTNMAASSLLETTSIASLWDCNLLTSVISLFWATLLSNPSEIEIINNSPIQIEVLPWLLHVDRQHLCFISWKA